MKKTKMRKPLACLMALLMLLTAAPALTARAADEVQTGKVSLPSASGTSDETYYYSDAWFAQPSGTENPSLATTSLLMAMSSVPVKADGYEAQTKNVEAFLKEMGFTNVQANQDYKEKMTTDSMGVAIGMKELKAGDESCTLLAIVPRSGGYEREWGGNFNVGESGQHKGFAEACGKAVSFLGEYIKENEISGPLKVWVAGHSRGGATANVIGAFLADNGENVLKEGGADVTLKADDIYAYTFGTPNTTTDSKTSAKGIFNYLSSEDPFTLLPLASWGFTKYGKTVDLDEGKTPSGISAAAVIQTQLSSVKTDRADYVKRVEPVLRKLFETVPEDQLNTVVVASVLMLTDTSGDEFTEAKVQEIMARSKAMMEQFSLESSVLSSHGGAGILEKLRARDPLYQETPGGEDKPGTTDTPAATGFRDVKDGDWYKEAVDWAVEKGYVAGTSAETFEPDTHLNRGMVATILHRIAGKPAAAQGGTFNDVPAGEWYSDGVAYAQASGLVKGYEDKTYRPTQNIKREELATILYRYMQAQGKGFSGTWMFLLDAPDASSVSEWADEAMHFMVMSEVMKGDANKMLRPGDTCTRAEAVTMLYRLMQMQ